MINFKTDNYNLIVYKSGQNSFLYESNNGSFVYHRKDDLPEVISSDGIKFWYKDNKLHRDNDLPAVVYPIGTMHWYKNGLIYREDGPARIFYTGKCIYYDKFSQHIKTVDYPADKIKELI